jgi:hypothetical protein
MGKGTKRKLREQEAAEAFERERARAVEEEVLASKPDEELFVVDTQAR